MRAVVLTRHGPPEVLRVEDRSDPRPGAGEIAVEVRAAGVNFADVMARMGLYMAAPKPPSVIGYEVAGVVSAVGDGVAHLVVGQRVMAGTRFGGYAERIVTRAQNALPLPERLTFEEGAAIPVNYATAAAALVRYGNVQAGERVLVHAAAGGVGVAATQIAKARGAEVWGTASPAKHDAIRALGVDHPVDYTRPGWEQALPKLDLVMDAIGGRSFRRSYALLRPGGRLVCFGASSLVQGETRSIVGAIRTLLAMPRFNLVSQMEHSKTVIGLNLLALWDEFGALAAWLEPVVTMLDRGPARPVVAAAVPFAQAAEAHRMLGERRNVGKVVLVP
ncbi:MAG TPA: zinc-binding dehydrogenase [Candidatus Binatia bacterium]|jgi:NADPH:quinone reductase-like Zn-dependent oxidoreductase